MEYSVEQLTIIDEMALHQARDATIARVLDVDHNTFKTDMAERTRRQRAEGQRRVLRAQFEAATSEEGTPTDRIWWGKQHLGQRDKADVDHGLTDPAMALMKELDGSRHLPGTSIDA